MSKSLGDMTAFWLINARHAALCMLLHKRGGADAADASS